jgi:hypothetical protein
VPLSGEFAHLLRSRRRFRRGTPFSRLLPDAIGVRDQCLPHGLGLAVEPGDFLGADQAFLNALLALCDDAPEGTKEHALPAVAIVRNTSASTAKITA